MLKRAIGTRYARALFELARDTGKLAAIEKDLPSVARILDAEPELYRFLTHPAIRYDEKKSVVSKLLEGKIDELLFNFIYLLIDKKREAYLPIVSEEFDALAMDYHGRQTAKIFTAFGLSDEMRSQLAAGLSKMTGKKVEIEEEVDSSLIGGIKVMIGDKVYDGSVKSNLSDIREELMSAKV
jgi:F-type H+-transporting ATPase subunit delta